MKDIQETVRSRHSFTITSDLVEAVAGYYEAIVFTEEERWLEDHGYKPLSLWEIPHPTFDRMLKDVAMAYGLCSHLVGPYLKERYTWTQFGRDLWLTRTGSGISFEDRPDLDPDIAAELCAMTKNIFGVDIWVYQSDEGPMFHD